MFFRSVTAQISADIAMASRTCVSLLNATRLNQVWRRVPQIVFRKIHHSQGALTAFPTPDRNEANKKRVFTTNKLVSALKPENLQTRDKKGRKEFNLFQWDMVLIENGDLAIQECEPEDHLNNELPIIASVEKNSFFFSEDKSFSRITIPNRQVTCEEWDNFFTEFLETRVTTRNLLQIKIIEFLLDTKGNDGIRSDVNWNSSDLVQSYIEYLMENEEAFMVAQPALVFYFRLCKLHHHNEDAFSIILRIKDKVKTWNAKFLIEVYFALLRIDADRIKEEDILSYFPSSALPRHTKRVFQLHFDLCCRCNERKLAVECMKIYLDKVTTQASSFELPVFQESSMLSRFFEMFGYTDDPVLWKENREVVENFFDYLHRRRVYFSSDAQLQTIENWFRGIKSENWNAQVFYSSDVRNGTICPVTGQRMLSHRLTTEEASVLKQNTITSLLGTIFSDIDTGILSKHLSSHSDWYTTATPTSVHAYLEFLVEHGPFDVVMDGVNLLYSSGVAKNRMFDRGVDTVRQTIKNCRRDINNPKILVVVRNHLRHTLKKDGPDLFDLADIFFLDNDHEDDAFLLYAALCSGKDCLVISNDLFRNHKARMVELCGTQTATLFRKFQSSRQIPVFPHTFNFSLNIPEKPDPILQRKGDVWHFPLWQKEEDQKYTSGAHRWLCVYKDDAR